MLKFVAQPSIDYSQALLAAIETLVPSEGDDAVRVWVQHSEGGLTFSHQDSLRVCKVEVWGAVSVEFTRIHYVNGTSCIGSTTEKVAEVAKKIIDFFSE